MNVFRTAVLWNTRILWIILIPVILISACVRGERVTEIPRNAETAPEIPTLRFAYCWSHGFTPTLTEYAKEVRHDFALIPEPNNGIQHRPKILIDVASDRLPDVFTFWSYETNLRYFVDNDFLVDIQEIFDASPLLHREDFHDFAMEATEIDGRNYAIPYEWFYGFFVVNEALLENLGLIPPRTWDDLIAMTPVLRERDIVPLSMGSYLGDPGHTFFSALAYQARRGYEDAVAMKKTGLFMTPATLAAAQAVQDLVRHHVVPEDSVRAGGWDFHIDQFNRGRTAMTYTFSWTLSLFDPSVAERTAIIPVPSIPAALKNRPDFTVGGLSQSICVSRKAWQDPVKRPRILRFLEWLLSEETFALRMRQEGCVPARKMELPEFSNPIYAKAASYAEGLEVRKLHEFYFDSMSAFENYKSANDLLWSGAVDAQGFLELVQSGMADE